MHCSTVGCNNKHANKSEVIYLNLPKDPLRRESWSALISRDKSWIYKPAFLHRQTNKKKTDFDFNSKYQHLGKLLRLAKQKQKEEVKL